ncbi:hypothetical protein DPMN_019762 [Dreissena polymorpha]|jgi:hypothetical protein|uniref:Uncharacterized protein n=1 Tax=Dreissena polymorpha TaxID=45954 RepID=A0A9D4C7K6_DREPO|nr:hypothetical protein DPMN_193302 [Dreissena polymorpha]KAH3718928.1 hypothetical protein DPMN_061754 [Dreissena polymorpha]KAH3721676.1 hypothetical protein DPMN_064623 [Dreissena polymorpha]KAH3790902.1 hypothetical protein DPMN_169110 [Dreissena polymorpha]KAH3814292.1 hypothetical protein DPMN_142787 [Dreissena polymorpha]
MDGPKPGEKLKLGVEPDNLSYENLLVTKMQNSLRTDISDLVEDGPPADNDA